MKRDMDFIREILLRVEDDPRLNGSHFVVFNTSDFEGRTQDEIAYHIDLLFENDFVKGIATLDAPAAVSYTHLDVYKRQVIPWRRRPAGHRGSKTSPPSRQGERVFLTALHPKSCQAPILASFPVSR